MQCKTSFEHTNVPRASGAFCAPMHDTRKVTETERRACCPALLLPFSVMSEFRFCALHHADRHASAAASTITSAVTATTTTPAGTRHARRLQQRRCLHTHDAQALHSSAGNMHVIMPLPCLQQLRNSSRKRTEQADAAHPQYSQQCSLLCGCPLPCVPQLHCSCGTWLLVLRHVCHSSMTSVCLPLANAVPALGTVTNA